MVSMQAINPIAFELGPLAVRWYGLIIGLGIFLATIWSSREADKHRYPKDFMVDILFWLLPISILGARIYYVLFTWELYASNPLRIFAVWEGGIAIYGALLAGAAVFIWYCRKRRTPIILTLDIVAPTVLMAQALGRWGNFVNQEAYGGEVTRQFLESLHLPTFIIDQMHINGTYYHPTFLYESVLSVIGVIVIVLLRRRKKLLHVGETSMLYVIWYGITRFFVEGMRSDSLWLGPLRISQALSLVLVIGAVILWIYRRRQGTAQFYSEAFADGKGGS